jgi:hypothetical protein
MAENYTPNPVATFVNDTTAVNTVNNNFAAISTAFTDVLSRSGVSPNQMTSALDMNNNQIINLPPPSTVNSPARLIDVVTPGSITVTTAGTGTSGHAVPFLDGNNIWSGNQMFKSGDPWFDVKAFGAVGDGTTDDTTAIQAAITAAGSNSIVVFPYTGNPYKCGPLIIGNGSASGGSTVQNIVLRGLCGDGSSSVVDTQGKTIKLKYSGTLGGVFLTINGPGVFGLENLEFDGNSVAGTGLVLNHVYRSRFQGLNFTNFTQIGIRQTAYPNATNVFIGSDSNTFDNISINNQGVAASTGVDIGIAVSSGLGLDVGRDIWNHLEIEVGSDSGSTGIILRGCDGVTFNNAFVACPLPGITTAFGIKVISPTGNNALPANIVFNNAAIVGRISTPTDLSWRPDLDVNQGLNFNNFQIGDPFNFSIPLPVNATVGGIYGTTTDNRSLSSSVNAQVGTSYTFKGFDAGTLVTFSNANPIAVTLPQSTALNTFGSNWNVFVMNNGVGTVTITPTTSQIDGASTLVLTTNQGAMIRGDGTNYETVRFTSYAKGQIQGTGTNDSASSGNLGEFVSATIATGSAVPLTSSTIANVTSISLTAGDWDVWFSGYFNAAASTTLTSLQMSMSSANNTMDLTAGKFGSLGNQSTNAGGNPISVSGGVFRFSLAGTTSVFLNALSVFGTSTNAAWGTLQARRVR